MPEPTGIQQLEHLDQDVLDMMIRHNQLRPLVNSIITETELEPLVLTEAEQQRATATYRQRHNLKSAKDIQKHCKTYGFSKIHLQWQIQLQEQILRNSKNRFANKAELHYLKRKEQFDRVSYSQLIVKNQDLAQELFLRIKEDESDFLELATELTRGSDQKPQWQVGPIPMARVPKPLVKPLQSNSPGTLLAPIRVQTNWFVVRLEQYQPTEFDDAMEQRMCLELFQKHVSQLVDEQIETITSQFPQSASATES